MMHQSLCAGADTPGQGGQGQGGVSSSIWQTFLELRSSYLD